MLTHSPLETRQFGEKLSTVLKPGDVLLLQGDLGAGKSELTRGIAKGLGITGPVASPTFTILNVYDDGRIPLYHFDWYRLHDSEELYELGMDEYLGGDGIAVIEWPDVCPDAVPERVLVLTLTNVDDTTRQITWLCRGDFPPLPDEEFFA